MSMSPCEPSEDLLSILMLGTISAVEMRDEDCLILTYSDGRQVFIASPVGDLVIYEDGLTPM